MFPKLVRTENDQYSLEMSVERKNYITVRVGKNPRATNVYWQLVDPEFSLLELGFESPSGRLVHCSIPLFNGDIEDRSPAALPQTRPGTPLFDLSPWPLQASEMEVRGNHLKQSGRIRIAKVKDGLSIICRDAAPTNSIAYAEKLVCSFGEGGELIAITLIGDFPI